MQEALKHIKSRKTGNRAVVGTVFRPAMLYRQEVARLPPTIQPDTYEVSMELLLNVTQCLPEELIPRAEKEGARAIAECLYGPTKAVLTRVIHSLKYKDIDEQLTEEIEALHTLLLSYYVD